MARSPLRPARRPGGGSPRVERLGNGLTAVLVERRSAPLVTVALCYGAGAAAEEPAELGIAHFLEHMMFRGSARYGPGEIDRRTEAVGGSNNAFTSHDATVYYFSLAAEHWRLALDVEADRMTGLTLDPTAVAAERSVILEELAGLEDDPWGALELAVERAFHGDHPYGRPVLGSRATLATIGPAELRRFHHRLYRPENAVLVAAGDLGEELFDEAERRFGALAPAADRPGPTAEAAPAEPRDRRVVLRRGGTARLLLSTSAPAGGDPDHALLRLLLTVLAGGRSSRLHRLLVDGRKLCTSVGAELAECRAPSHASLACELMPGADPRQVEELIAGELRRIAGTELAAGELARAQRLLVADWAFAQETARGRALTAATAVALFDADQPERQIRQIEAARPDELARVASRFLGPKAPAVVGWSLPAGAAG